MKRENLNCWISRDGRIHPVQSSRHEVEYSIDGKRLGFCIRVSMPELQRTWVGIEARGKISREASVTVRALIRNVRRNGYQVIAERDTAVVDCLSEDRPTELYKMFTV